MKMPGSTEKSKLKNGSVTSYTDEIGKLNKNENYYVRAYCTAKDGARRNNFRRCI